MVEVRRSPAANGVATITLKCSGDMPGGLTRLHSAIMTRGAAPHRIAMVINRRSPAAAVMTNITTAGGENMVSGLARCSGAVVTGDAGSDYRRVVHPQRGPPATGVMTLSTVITGGDMFGVFAAGIDECTCTVTTTAAARRPFEDTVAMTAGAIDTGMSAIKGEASGEVVELFHILLGVGQRRGEERS